MSDSHIDHELENQAAQLKWLEHEFEQEFSHLGGGDLNAVFFSALLILEESLSASRNGSLFLPLVSLGRLISLLRPFATVRTQNVTIEMTTF